MLPVAGVSECTACSLQQQTHRDSETGGTAICWALTHDWQSSQLLVLHELPEQAHHVGYHGPRNRWCAAWTPAGTHLSRGGWVHTGSGNHAGLRQKLAGLLCSLLLLTFESLHGTWQVSTHLCC